MITVYVRTYSRQLQILLFFFVKKNCHEGMSLQYHRMSLLWVDWIGWCEWVQSYINHLCLKCSEKPWFFLSVYESTLSSAYLLFSKLSTELYTTFLCWPEFASLQLPLMINPEWQSRNYESCLTYNDSCSDGLNLPSSGKPGHGIHPSLWLPTVLLTSLLSIIVFVSNLM